MGDVWDVWAVWPDIGVVPCVNAVWAPIQRKSCMPCCTHVCCTAVLRRSRRAATRPPRRCCAAATTSVDLIIIVVERMATAARAESRWKMCGSWQLASGATRGERKCSVKYCLTVQRERFQCFFNQRTNRARSHDRHDDRTHPADNVPAAAAPQRT